VFIERPRDRSPDGRERLGRALAIRFRLDENVVMGALAAGRRLRAKADLAEPLARRLAQDLEAMGAVVAVSPHKASSSTGQSAVAPAAGGGTAAAHPPVPPRLVSAAPVAPEQVVTFSSYSANTPSLTLATLDGEDAEGPIAELSLATPPPPSPAPSGSQPPPPRTSGARDVFRPPTDEGPPLELVARPSRPGKIAPMPSMASARVQTPTVEATAVAGARSAPQVTLVSPDEGPPAPRSASAGSVPAPRGGFPDLVTRDPRGRLVAGLLLGLVVGFVPAHLYASFAEDKLDDIGAALAREPPPVSEADHALLMQQFDLAQARVGRVRARTVVVTAVVWLLAGAAGAAGYWRLTSRA
jgi:hypothetical protein